MEKRSLIFKKDIQVKDKLCKAGFAYELELEPYEFDRLTRQGCIYAGKDAKYFKEEKVTKPARKPRKEKKVEDNVDHKDSEQTEVQTDYSAQD